MEQKALAQWLKFILIGVGICGLIVYFLVLPSLGESIIADYPEFEYRFWPWLVFLWATVVPCYAALFFGWRIAVNIGADRSFIPENADHLKKISWLAVDDSVYLFLGNLIFLFTGMSHPGMTLFSLLVVFAGIAVTVASATLSHLVKKAAGLQEQSDLTI